MFLEVVNVDLVQNRTSESLFHILRKRSQIGGTRILLDSFLTLFTKFWRWIRHNYNVTLAIYFVGKIVKQPKNSRVFFVFVYLMSIRV